MSATQKFPDHKLPHVCCEGVPTDIIEEDAGRFDITRRRKCPVCDKEFYTIEATAVEYKQLYDAYKNEQARIAPPSPHKPKQEGTKGHPPKPNALHTVCGQCLKNQREVPGKVRKTAWTLDGSVHTRYYTCPDCKAYWYTHTHKDGRPAGVTSSKPEWVRF